MTTHIGLIATATTTYNEPYNIARRFASIDHISGGRAGWNLVTSQIEDEAQNFGYEEHVDHARRYERAAEFYDVVVGLWDSWEDGALLRDKASGVYMDRDKVHFLNHDGKHFKVRGPLNVARSPQGRPIVAQAGSSEAGRELAAKTADVIFTAQTQLHEAQAFYADVKGRAARYGRSAGRYQDHAGITPVLGPHRGRGARALRGIAGAAARRPGACSRCRISPAGWTCRSSRWMGRCRNCRRAMRRRRARSW